MRDALASAIVVPDDAAPAALTAAHELRGALARAGAPELPLVRTADPAGPPAFVVGVPPPGETEPRAPDACRVARRGDRLYLWGQGTRGPLYAVYAYLQDVLGFRWLTADVEVVPRLAEPALLPGVDLEQRPAFAVRDVGYREAFAVPWSARLRLNGEFCARGLGPAWGGGMRYTHFVHTFYQLVPPEQHFAAHPEYFSLVDGRRRETLAQLCLTNPDIVPIAADAVRAWFAADPAARIASVSQNDWLGACECPRCQELVQREGSQVGPVLHFVNAVARAVARDYPDRLIDTLAYWYTEDPPRTLRPEPNVAIRLCHMSPSCESHAITACPRNAPFAARLEAWSRIAPRLHIWDYHTNFSHFLMPFPNFAAIAADLALFHRRGVESVFCQGDLEEGGGGEWSTLRAYYLARLLWDTGLDPEALVDEFLRGVFPAAHRPVRAYFDGIQTEAENPDRHVRMFSPVQTGHLPGRVVAAAGAALREAAELAGDARERSAVRRLQLSLDYVRLAMPPVFSLEGDAIRPHAPEGSGPSFLAPEQRPQALATFLAELERQGIRALREAHPIEQFTRRAQVLCTSHAAPAWRAGAWQLRIVPDLGGRIGAGTFDGHPLFAPAVPDDADYPASRGYEETCAGDLGRTEAFALEAGAEGGPLVVTATLQGMAAWHHYAHIAVRREIVPDAAGGLRLVTTAANGDAVPHTLAIRPRFCLQGPVEGLEWRDPSGRWTVAEWDPALSGQAVARDTSGWRVRLGDLTFACLHDPLDRVQVEAHAWGWSVACVGVERPVPPGESISLGQRWQAHTGRGTGGQAEG